MSLHDDPLDGISRWYYGGTPPADDTGHNTAADALPGERTMKTNSGPGLRVGIAAAAAALMVAGCDGGGDEHGAGTRDAGVAGTKKHDAVVAAVNEVSDIAITATIKEGLARDATLGALAIDVDTAGGHVSLHGTAPSIEARERAGALARSVQGVFSVDNRLDVQTG